MKTFLFRSKLRHYVIGFLITCSMLACTASKQGRPVHKKLSGSWTLQTVNIEGITEKFAPKLFNEADLNCFIGSSWNFIADNHSGSYTLIGGSTGCSTLQRNIRWSVNEQKDAPREFQFNRLDANNKPMDDKDGFRLSITALEGNTMQLKSAITFEQKPGNIVYNFVKK